MRTNTSTGSSYLPADTGAILNIHFTVGNNGTTGVMTLDTTTFNSKSSFMTSIYGEYFPAGFKAGVIHVGGCCVGIRGNVNGDVLDEIDIGDLVKMVNFMFEGGLPPLCIEEANINASTGIPLVDISDLVSLVAYMFQG